MSDIPDHDAIEDLEQGSISMRAPRKRRIKTDPAHRLMRQAYKLNHRSPVVRRKATLKRKLYRRKNRPALLRKSKIAQRYYSTH